jgi:hypothetical protein
VRAPPTFGNRSRVQTILGVPPVGLHALLRARMPQRAVTAGFETPGRPLFWRHCMVGPWLGKPYTFRALRKTLGTM